MQVVATTGSKTCKAPVKSSPPTNEHPTFYRPDAFPVAQPTVPITEIFKKKNLAVAKGTKLLLYYRASLYVSAIFAVGRFLSVCLSACLSVTFVYCIRRVENIVILLSRSVAPLF